MKAKEIETMIDNEFPYWDELVLSIDCHYFGDEVKLLFECGDDVVEISFSECYTVEFYHADNFNKMRAVKDMERYHLPYYLQNISIADECIADRPGYFTKIDCSMLNLNIKSQKIKIRRHGRRQGEDKGTVLLSGQKNDKVTKTTKKKENPSR